MIITKEELIKKFTSAIREGNAAIFAGAGLSSGSGYVNWTELLRPFAAQIGLDIEKENDYLAVAQYYRNERGNRAAVNNEILNQFRKETMSNDALDIVTRLPIYSYWTTNYDKLLEDGLSKANRRADVKIETAQLANPRIDRDAIVYKMHGDVDHADNAVLTKDDYVLYDKKRRLFKTVLKGDLVSKTFLFIGFSFEDPNLDYVLDQIHVLLDENVHDHYCFFRKVKKDGLTDEDYGYAKARQELKAKDLARYGIQTVFVDEYSEITEILQSIEGSVKHCNVFISGSASDYGSWEAESAEKLAFELANKLVRNNYKITSGYGLGIGSAVISGALQEIYNTKYRHTDEYLSLRPFPQGISDPVERKRLFTEYRQDMIRDTGVAIFMFGNKRAGGSIVNAPGCREEFEIAKVNGNVIIPIGSTGFMAKELLDEMKADLSEFPYLAGYVDKLYKETDIDKIIDIVLEIIKKSQKV